MYILFTFQELHYLLNSSGFVNQKMQDLCQLSNSFYNKPYLKQITHQHGLLLL